MPERKQSDKPGQEMPRGERSPSMHEGVETWCDTCSCEAEKRWEEVGEEGEGATG